MRPFNLECEGKEYLINFLYGKGFTDIIDTDVISQYTHWDVEASYKGRKIIFEIKCRDFLSTDWGDTEINYDKYSHLINSPYDAFLVTFWKDKWCIINVKKTKPTKIYEKMAQKTHRWKREKVNKKFVNWDIRNMKLMEYDQI